MTLSFEKILSELSRKSLLRYLITMREKALAGGGFLASDSALDKNFRQLEMLGLADISSHIWYLSDFGRKFLVRFDYETSKS